MISSIKQEQTSGDSSTNIQAGTVIVNGVTYEEARQIAVDVFKCNALELAGIAKETARLRAEHITERFLKDLAEKNPSALESASDPDFQHCIFDAQRAYARSGDEGLEDVLVDLLGNRASVPERNFKQVVLNEAIAVLPKLTTSQINIITLLFRVRHTVRYGLVTMEQLANLIVNEMLPFLKDLPDGDGTYRHLAFTGVATVEITSLSFINIIREVYSGLCSKGVDLLTVNQFVAEEPKLGSLFIKFPNSDADKLNLVISTSSQLDTYLQELGVTTEETISKVKNLLNSNPITDEEITAQLMAFNPQIQLLINKWDKSAAKQTLLTPVGMAIGHANASKHGSSLNVPLDVWVN